MSEKRMKIQDKKRYLLWLISLIIAIVLFVVIASTAMIPGKYLALLGVILLAVYGGLFAMQLRWGKGRFLFTTLVEILLAVICIVGISVVSQATQMVENITSQGKESELISVYVLADSSYESVEDAADGILGVVDNQSEQAVTQLIDRLSKQWNKGIDIVRYPDMFTAADALKAGEIQVLVLNDAFAELISDIEGYEWFATEVRVLETSVEEVKVEVPVIPETQVSGNSADISGNDGDGTPSDEEGEKADSKPEEPVKMELMEPPEQVDWNALVNQEMLAVPEGTFVVYISGVDTWGSASTRSRSDVNILAVVNTNTKKVLLVSTPRDYYVPLSISGGVKDKLTHAGIYGVNTSMETLEMLYAVDIQYYVRMNFTGFVGIIDALGGIDVYSDSTFTVGDAFSYTEGMNHMSGIEALAFARERYSFAGGDRARGTHQMEVIKAVLNKCASSAILYNYADVMNSMSGCFVTDMSKEKIASLVKMQLTDMASWTITSVSVDGTGDSKTTFTVPEKRAYVMIPDETTVQNAKDQIAAVLNGQ